ncbi:MAG: hypothetical protein H0X40_02050 [Chthoniobacterales bacterium]|nr:hypothetical protein [Chthoniobacterales bacterium]
MFRSDNLLLTDEELRLRRNKRRRIVVSVATVLLLLAGGFFLARPARHAVKAWQARRHAGKAMRAMAAEDWSGAEHEAIAAYQLDRTEPEATRALARFLSRARQGQALEFWEQLAKAQPLTKEDLRDEAAIALAVGELERAQAAIKSLLGNEGKETAPGDQLLAAQLAAQSGAPNESRAALQKVFAARAATAREQLQAAVLELRLSASGSEQDKKTQADAWQRIEKLSSRNDATGLDALVLLAQRALTAPNESKSKQANEAAPASSPAENGGTATIAPTQLAAALDAHPLAKTAQKLLAVDLRIHSLSNEKSALIDDAIQRWRGAENESVLALATWLNGKGEYERELETVPLERSLQMRELFLQHVDALGALGRWEDIRHLLQSERFPLDPMIGQMYLARCYAQLGQQTASDNSWQRALEAANGNSQKLMTLAEYAEKNGASAIAANAYSGAVAATPNLRAAWQGKLRLAQSSRDTKAIHATLAEMLKLWPNDTAIQNDEAYIRLLLLGSNRKDNTESPKSENKPLVELEKLAQELVRREPGSLPHRTLFALVYLRENRPYTALNLYKDLNIAAGALSSSALAVHAAALAATGNTEGATEEAGKISRSDLLPEERDLISGF